MCNPDHEVTVVTVCLSEAEVAAEGSLVNVYQTSS